MKLYEVVDKKTRRVEFTGTMSDCATYISQSLKDEHFFMREKK